jgi:hypothetical protein
VTKKMKICTTRDVRESQDKPLMTNIISITTKEDNELHERSSRGLSIIKIHRKRRGGSFCGELFMQVKEGCVQQLKHIEEA